MPTYYHNEILFSEIYLEEITRQTENADVLASLKVLGEYREYADTHNLKAWKESYVHEVLSALGFFAQSKNDHLTHLFSMGSDGKETPLSLCYVILPEENLGNTTIGRNWAEKIIRALRENNLQWGLLTNGKQWRIYHQDEPTPYETYLEIDLEAILKEKAKEAYQIFHKFMKAENFAVQEDGKCQFDRFKKESQDKIDYIEKELANALKQREEGGKGVLSDLCMGYVEELRQRKEGDLDDEGLRKKIYHGAMLYMFRLLFLFYADSRRLLSDENHELLAKVEGECRARHDGNNLSTTDIQIWDSLERIFVDIDQTYNGGLFSPQESEFTRFLSDTRIGDTYLSNVIFNLSTYHEKNGQEKPISYRDMSVRHLGTLYEGLLEHKLFIANEDTEVKVSKGKIQFIPKSQGGKLLVGHYIKGGEVYFAGDPTERKSSGSYFTPEDVVNKIVSNTVGEKLKDLEGLFLSGQQTTLKALISAVDDDEHRVLTKLIEENAFSFVREQVLTLSVLDPAMGSGHFLVNATNLISNFITKIINDLGIEGDLETDTANWRRWVVENCIYGVDLNPLAVELAKLSLWILSMAKNQPLSFMNHHLKCGNSLVGARLEEIGNYPLSTSKKEPQQLHLFERDPDFKIAVEEAIEKEHMIASKSSLSLEDIHEKKAWLDDIEELLGRYKAICNVHVGILLGNGIDENQYLAIVKKKDFALARKINKSVEYFHWQLEFPFLLRTGGFSVVIGNPPWISFGLRGVGVLDELLESYLRSNFPNSAEYKLSLYAVFMEAAINLLQQNGIHSFIVPDSFLLGQYFYKVRTYILNNTRIQQLVLFLEDFWQGASIGRCVIYSLKKESDYRLLGNSKTEVIEAKTLNDFSVGIFRKNSYSQKVFGKTSLSRFRLFFDETTRTIIEKMETNSIPLANVVKFYSGLIGLRGKDSIVISEKPSDFVENKYGKLIPSGRYLQRYKVTYNGEYIRRDKKLYKSGYDENKYLSPKIFLNQTGDSLKACYDNEGYFCLNNMHIGYSVDPIYDLRFVNAILCSKLMNFYYHAISLEFGRAMAQIDIETLDQLPLPKVFTKQNKSNNEKIDFSIYINDLLQDQQSEQIESIIDRLLASIGNENYHDFLSFIVQELLIIARQNPSKFDEVKFSVLDHVIDMVVYRLYALSNDEVQFIEDF